VACFPNSGLIYVHYTTTDLLVFTDVLNTSTFKVRVWNECRQPPGCRFPERQFPQLPVVTVVHTYSKVIQ